MVFVKHNSLKSDIFCNPIFIAGFSGSKLFRVQVFQGLGSGSGSRIQDPGPGSRVKGPGPGSRVQVQNPGPGFRNSQYKHKYKENI